MRVKSILHTAVFFITMLTCSLPLVALAQQNSVQAEAEAAAAQAVDAVRLAAIAAAELDASSDINKLACVGIGAGAALVGGWCGALFVGDSYVSPSWPEVVTIIGGLAGGTGILSALIGSYIYLPNPPPEKLIGKSPEYVMFYADAYRAKTQSLRVASVFTGTAIGCGGTILLLGPLSVNQSPTYPD